MALSAFTTGTSSSRISLPLKNNKLHQQSTPSDPQQHSQLCRVIEWLCCLSKFVLGDSGEFLSKDPKSSVPRKNSLPERKTRTTPTMMKDSLSGSALIACSFNPNVELGQFEPLTRRTSSENPMQVPKQDFGGGDSELGLKPQQLVDPKRDFGERGRQAIMKLMNIHFTPDKSSYLGGTWHIEERGHLRSCYLLRERKHHIDVLSFRQVAENDAVYEQGDHGWSEPYLVSGHQYSIQELGRVKTTEGCVSTFPNIMQDQDQPSNLLTQHVRA
ncbi:hypothetical protein BDN72DRAFT_145444 [Pluteus cervinus]|uniref:Uncharacterized protein n=1 Tax=Pluteus cervinus TaxID=181527 RepID=A0ACD3AKN7_9AGAR|nr:hypothetical protein BDN72DRAFT_145444 [Pluteus cervinus]